MKHRFLLVFMLFVYCFSITSYAGYWQLKDDGYYWVDDTEYRENRWLKSYGYWYYLGPRGKMLVGQKDNFFFNDGSYTEFPYGALVEKENPICVDSCIVDDIEYLRIHREDVEYTKLVFILHGIDGCKEDMQRYGTQLAAEDCLVYVQDMYAYGNSEGKGTLVDIINNTSKAIDIILSEENIAGDESITIFGYSLGGMVGADYVVSGEHKVDKLVMLASAPDISILDNTQFCKVYHNGKVIGEMSRSVIKSKLVENSAFTNIDAFKGVKMLIINNIDDSLIPYKKVLETVGKLTSVTDVECRGREREGHQMNSKDFMEAVMFIQDWK